MMIFQNESDELKCETLKSYEIDEIYQKDKQNLPDIINNPSVTNYLLYFQYNLKKFLNLNKLYKELETLDYSQDQEEDITDFFQKTIEYNKDIAEKFRLDIGNFIIEFAKLDKNLLDQYRDKIILLDNKYFQLIKDFEEKTNNIIDDLIAKIEAKEQQIEIIEYSNTRIGDIFYVHEQRNNLFVKCQIIKKNQKSVIIRILDTDMIKKYGFKTETNCSYSQLNRNPESYMKKIEEFKKFEFVKSNYYTEKDLKELMEKTKEEYKDIFKSIFNQLDYYKLNNVNINWGQQNFRTAGFYKYPQNRIEITSSLKFTPEFVIKSVIFHELLHIHFHCHGSEFRFYEKKFKQYKEANEFIHKLFMKLRYEKGGRR